MYYGTHLVEEGDITVGAISAFLLYMILLCFDFMIMGFVAMGFHQMFGAAEKIVKLMKHIAVVNSHGGTVLDITKCDGVIELKNVVFRYPVNRSV